MNIRNIINRAARLGACLGLLTSSIPIFAQPANDNPCGAIPLTVNAACTYTAGTNVAATATPGIPAPGCASYVGADVWFSVVVPAGGQIIIDSNVGGITDGGMALYTATACNGTFTLLECDDDDSPNGLMPYINRTGLVAGSTVYIRFWEYNGDLTGTFNICVTGPPTAPANDNPCGATPLSVNASCVYTGSTTAGATATTGIPAPGCGNYVGSDVWFSVVVPASGNLILDSQTGGIFDSGMALYSATACNGTFTLIECDDDDSPNGAMSSITRTGLTPGATLYVRFWEFGGDANGTFSICASIPPPPPTNDNPCTATNLPVNTNCVNTVGNTGGSTATTGPPAPTCASYLGFDLWYSVVVPASGSIIIETTAGTVTDGGMALYTAPNCTGPFVQQACDDDGGPGLMPLINANGLAPGSTVYVRVWEYFGDGVGTFSICVRTPPPPPVGDCVYVLNLFDSFGDGWGSSNVGVRINGGPWTYYTVGGSDNQVLIGVNINDLIELTYDNSGPFQFENSYTLGLSGGGVYFNSGNAPPPGISFQQLVDCQPPPAAPQDCNGGFTICSGQAFNNNSSNTGNVVDLNTSNQGCLASGERQGTWYYFSPSSSGTIGFTIAPVVAADYDFAVWGPMSTVTCPPVGPPLRCSYAAPTGPTGLGNGAIDLTEGAGGDRWVATINALAGQVYILYVDNFSSNGQAFDLTWQLSNGASLDCTLLPVELVNLEAHARDLKVNLAWTTLSETDADHFVVERAADGVNFEPIGQLAATGNSSVSTDYDTWDEGPRKGLNYYRLTMVDADGSIMHSPVVSALVLATDNDPFIAPNPASRELRITLPKGLQGALELRIIDAAGRIVETRTIVLLDDATYADLNVERLEPGAYTLGVYRKDGAPIGHTAFVKE